ncbi:hypothetical protein [Noviherbaspirillum saxi]|uniref:hypothetical protein n=1 Tax=Noviherbaspirillum saxi TaxID=2320863 RepID=UPI0011C3EA20|nr:hypothetical protein [Noviherbaspirillum saxi]
MNNKYLLALPLVAALGGCTITPNDNQVPMRLGPPPPAIQGSNDAQGSPLSVPGSGMGVGSGNPAAPGPAGLGGSSMK